LDLIIKLFSDLLKDKIQCEEFLYKAVLFMKENDAIAFEYLSGDEFVCYVNVSNIDDLKSFIKYLKEEINLNMSEIGELTSEIWAGYGFDELEPHFGEETSNKIIDESWAYLCDLFPN
jgi:hypothetical protein